MYLLDTLLLFYSPHSSTFSSICALLTLWFVIDTSGFPASDAVAGHRSNLLDAGTFGTGQPHRNVYVYQKNLTLIPHYSVKNVFVSFSINLCIISRDWWYSLAEAFDSIATWPLSSMQGCFAARFDLITKITPIIPINLLRWRTRQNWYGTSVAWCAVFIESLLRWTFATSHPSNWHSKLYYLCGRIPIARLLRCARLLSFSVVAAFFYGHSVVVVAIILSIRRACDFMPNLYPILP